MQPCYKALHMICAQYVTFINTSFSSNCYQWQLSQLIKMWPLIGERVERKKLLNLPCFMFSIKPKTSQFLPLTRFSVWETFWLSLKAHVPTHSHSRVCSASVDPGNNSDFGIHSRKFWNLSPLPPQNGLNYLETLLIKIIIMKVSNKNKITPQYVEISYLTVLRTPGEDPFLTYKLPSQST